MPAPMNVVLTGSSTGIGHALALRLLMRGHHVWGLARSDQSAQVSAHAGAFRASRCDVSEWNPVARVAAEVAGHWAHVDAIVTCAGIHGEIGRTLTADPVGWAATVRTNLDG